MSVATYLQFNDGQKSDLDMMDERVIRRVDTLKKCKQCGYLATQLQFELAREDYDCPRCGGWRLSEFIDQPAPGQGAKQEG